MFVWHNDKARADHPDMTIPSTSDLCPNPIWRFRDLPAPGIQGHPEIAAARAPVWFEANRARIKADGADVDRPKAQAAETAEAKTMPTCVVEVVRGARPW